MSARGYALYSVCPQLSFFFYTSDRLFKCETCEECMAHAVGLRKNSSQTDLMCCTAMCQTETQQLFIGSVNVWTLPD